MGKGDAGYRVIAVVVGGLLANQRLGRWLFTTEQAALRHIGHAMGLSQNRLDHAEQRQPTALMLQRPLHILTAGLPTREQAEQLFEPEGLGPFLAAQASGRGVILVHSHTLLVRTFWHWLRWYTPDPGLILHSWSKSHPQVGLGDPVVQVIEGAGELFAAQARLEQGGLVHVLADGYKGQQGIVLPFAGRQRPFQTGFAELALLTGATVLPVALAYTKQWNIAIHFGPPLAFAAVEQPHRQRIRGLVEQYAACLQEQWHQQPQEIAPYHMRCHLELPTI